MKKYFYSSFLLVILFFNACDSESTLAPELTKEPSEILFVSDQTGTYQLYSMNEDGSHIQQLTDNPDISVTDAKWSPSGKSILTVSYNTSTPLPFNDEKIHQHLLNDDRRSMLGSPIYMCCGNSPYFTQEEDTLYFVVSFGGYDPFSCVYRYDIMIRRKFKELREDLDDYMIGGYHASTNRLVLTYPKRYYDSVKAHNTYSSISCLTNGDGKIIETFGSAGSGRYLHCFSNDGSKIALKFWKYSDNLHYYSFDEKVIRKVIDIKGKEIRCVAWSKDDSKMLINISNHRDKNDNPSGIIVDLSGNIIHSYNPFDNAYVRFVDWNDK